MWRGFSNSRRQTLHRPKAYIITFLLVVFASAAHAQTRGGFNGGFHGGFHNNGGFAGNRGRYPAFWGDPYFYADYPYLSLASAPAASPVVIVQPAATTGPEPERPPESVMIEWQDDHYVRSNGQHPASASQDFSSTSAASISSEVPVGQSELPPATLVYRDGHREQVADYVIASGNLYAHGDYYRDGYWTKNVQLAALDIPATIMANQRSGVKFVLPSGPNQVVTRP